MLHIKMLYVEYRTVRHHNRRRGQPRQLAGHHGRRGRRRGRGRGRGLLVVMVWLVVGSLGLPAYLPTCLPYIGVDGLRGGEGVLVWVEGRS
jgi:hypothetical protein